MGLVNALRRGADAGDGGCWGCGRRRAKRTDVAWRGSTATVVVCGRCAAQVHDEAALGVHGSDLQRALVRGAARAVDAERERMARRHAERRERDRATL